MFDWGSESMEEFWFRLDLRCFALERAQQSDVLAAVATAQSVDDLVAVIAGPLAREVSARSALPPAQVQLPARTTPSLL